jgi:hypothetical protein
MFRHGRQRLRSIWNHLFPTRCAGCGEPLTAANRSSAHIIPNALGGRLTSAWLICAKCNTELDHLADHALIEAFGVIPTLLKIPRQRGTNPPKNLQTRNGANVRLDPDGSLTATDMKYDVSTVPGGHSVDISAPDRKRAAQLIKRAAKQFPQLDPQLAEAHARAASLPPDEELAVRVNFGSAAVGGGAWSIMWLFYLLRVRRPLMPWSELKATIVREQKQGTCFGVLSQVPPGLNGPNLELGHVIVLRLVPSTGELVAFVQILGVLKLAGVLGKARAGRRGFTQIYAYDVEGGREVTSQYSIEATAFDAHDWANIGIDMKDAEAARAEVEKVLEVVRRAYVRRTSTLPY